MAAGSELRTAFLDAAEASVRARAEALELGERLSVLVEAGRAAHPLVDVPPEMFAGRLAANLEPEGDIESQLDHVQAGDLWLACGCALGDRAAIAAFDAAYGRDVDAALARAGKISVGFEEFRQRIHERLFVRDGDRAPRITAYGGRGTLRGWLRVTAVRLAIDLARTPAEAREAPARDADLFERIPGRDDPELATMREAWGSQLREVMARAFAQLSVRQRNLLRQHYLHGLSGDRLATIYAVHRATAFRWLDGARDALMAAVRTALAERLRIDDRELASMMQLLGSRVDLSVRRLLEWRLENDG